MCTIGWECLSRHWVGFPYALGFLWKINLLSFLVQNVYIHVLHVCTCMCTYCTYRYEFLEQTPYHIWVVLMFFINFKKYMLYMCILVCVYVYQHPLVFTLGCDWG